MLLRATLTICTALALSSACPGPPDKPPTPAQHGWRLTSLPITTPGARWGHITAAGADGTWFFGGTDIALSTDEGVLFADVWHVNIDGTVVFTPVATDAGVARRYCGCAAKNDRANTLLVIGGYDDDAVAIHDAWEVDLTSGVSTVVAGVIPAGIIGCGAAFLADTDTAYVFGGGSESFVSGKTWRYDGVTRTFTEVLGPGPSGRFDHALRASMDGHTLWSVGGTLSSASGFYADVWRFDSTTQAWTQLPITGPQPRGRRTPWVAVRDDDAQIVMGFGTAGGSPDSDLRDVWLLDVARGRWTELDVEGDVQARAFSPYLRAPGTGVGLVYGGTDMVGALSDVAVLEAPSGSTASWH